jgi:hypothetical protein
MWVWQNAISKSIGLSYMLSPNTCELGKTPDPNLLGLATCGAQICVNLTRYLIQFFWSPLRVEHKRIWVCKDTIIKILGFIIILDPNI